VRITAIGAVLLIALTGACAFTQSPPETDSLADDPRAEVLNAVYCPK
jgi:hypothetical protein